MKNSLYNFKKHKSISWSLALLMLLFTFSSCFALGPIAGGRVQTTDYRLETVDCRRQTVGSRLETTKHRLKNSISNSRQLKLLFDSRSPILNSPGSITLKSSPFRFSSYYSDPESGMDYLNARYYSPMLQRFVSRDTYDLSNRYAYCDASPVASVDPNGHTSNLIKTIAGIAGVGATVLSMAALNIVLPVVSDSIDSAAIVMALTSTTDKLSVTEAIADEGVGSIERLSIDDPLFDILPKNSKDMTAYRADSRGGLSAFVSKGNNVPDLGEYQSINPDSVYISMAKTTRKGFLKNRNLYLFLHNGALENGTEEGTIRQLSMDELDSFESGKRPNIYVGKGASYLYKLRIPKGMTIDVDSVTGVSLKQSEFVAVGHIPREYVLGYYKCNFTFGAYDVEYKVEPFVRY